MRKEKKSQTKRNMFVSYIVIPIVILSVFSCVFTSMYFRMSRTRILTFERTISENVDKQLKNVMDNLLKSASQYSMTPWVKRLKYMQKIPDIMKTSITASDISDYASTISLTEINDIIIESVYIYYSLGEFGISSSGKVGWEDYIKIYKIESDNQELMNGELLRRNNQQVICHDITLTKNAKRVRGFYLIQTIPLENSYSGDVNILFFVPYSDIYQYIEKFTDDGTGQFCLTDGEKVLYTQADDEKQWLQEGDLISNLKSGTTGYTKNEERGIYAAEYTKTGMKIGIVQILDPAFLYRDFQAFLRWILMGDILLTGLILLISLRMTKRSYQPLENIMNLLEDQDEDSTNEYEMIEKALRDLESQKQRLEVAVYEQNPLVEQYILHGLFQAKQINTTEEKYINTMRQYRMYRALALSDGPEVRQYLAEMDSCLAIYPQVHAAYIKEDKYYFWILSYGEEGLIEEITELLVQTFTELGYRDAVMGLSSFYEDIRKLPEACAQAADALEYHFFCPEKKIIRYEENGIHMRGGSSEKLVIAPEKLEKLSELAEQCDAQLFAELYRDILVKAFEERMVSREAWFTAARSLNEYSIGLFAEQNGYMEQLELIDPKNFSSMENYLQTFRLKLENWMERTLIHENPMYTVRNEKIKAYVEAHLTDANLSLNETARVMHFTSTYFGKYFKEQFGCAFQQYVAVRRVECAKEYMRDDPDGKKMNIQEIALRCGFTNDVTFRRTFKRYTGVNPSQYCKQ